MPSPTPASTARDILRRARRQQRLSQAQLAARAGVSKTVIARYESGQQPTVAALERLVAACGYELEWTLRSGDGASGAVSEAPAQGTPFPGPIGRRLSTHLDEVLDLLSRAGVSEPRLYGDVADGCEGVGSWVVIGVSIPPQVSHRDVLVASGQIGLLIDASVRVLAHSHVVDYGWDGDGVPLTGEESPPIRRCG